MSEMQSFSGNERIQRLENYYADDSPLHGWNAYPWGDWTGPTYNTQETFSWRAGIDINQEVEWGAVLLNPPGPNSLTYSANYDWHSGPVTFYSDCVSANLFPATIPSGLQGAGCPFDYQQIGWMRSLYALESVLPQITTQPANRSGQVGGTATFTVTANRTTAYQWYKVGGGTVGTGSSVVLNNLSSGDAGSYVVRVSNANGQLYSQPATLTVGAATLAISSVSPSVLTGVPPPQTQLIKIFGSGFSSGSTLTLNDGVDAPYTGRVPTFVSANELDYNVAVGTNQANWTVQVIDGAQQSNLGAFTVVAPPPPTGGSLVVTLQPPGAVAVGAQWRLDGGTYRNSGYVMTNLTAGSHTVSCKSVTGYTAPGSHSVSITNGSVTTDTETYTAIVVNNSSITVTLSPATAIAAGAQWCVDGGSYHNSGETVSGLSAGFHTISFKPISGFVTPQDISASLASNTSYGYSVTYSAAYYVVCAASPSNAGSTTGSGVYQASSWATVVAVPRLNYALGSWTESGQVVSTDATYTFWVSTNRNLTANFVFWGPTAFAATAVSKSAVGLTWEANGNSVASLIIEKTNASSGVFESVATLPRGTTCWIDTNVSPNMTYSYRVRAWDGSVTYSAYSTVVSRSTEPVTSAGTQCSVVNGMANCWAIACDKDNVYWSSISDAGCAIWKINKSDGLLTALGSGIADVALAIAVRSNYIYWAESNGGTGAGAIRMVSVNGGTIATITSNGSMGAGDGIRGLAVDESGVYWTETGAQCYDYAGQIRGVVGVPVDNPELMAHTQPIVLADKLRGPWALAVDADFVYWTGLTDIGRIGKAGGAVSMLATNHDELHGIAVDTASVYFSEWNGSVYKVPKAGGTEMDLGSIWTQTSSDFLAVDDNYVYSASVWLGSVNRLAKGGGGGGRIASGNRPWGIAVDRSGLYWTEEPTRGTPIDGNVGMLAWAPPTIVVSTNWSIAANATSSLGFNVSDGFTPNDRLVVVASSSNTGLVSAAGMILTGASNSRGLTVTPTTNQVGTSTITLTVTNDAGLTASASVLVTVVMPTFVSIPDPSLETAVRSALGKPNGAITTWDMQALTSLYASWRSITNLAGLESATNLTTLYLQGNAIRNVAALAGLRLLTYLDLSANGISDPAFITGLTNVQSLNLSGNSITNSAGLCGLANITTLELDNAGIANAGFLACMTNLNVLSLAGNAVSDLTPLQNDINLTSLNLSYNPVTNYLPVTGLSNLSSLTLNGNSISNLSFVQGLTRLGEIYVNRNHLGDLTALTGLTNLFGIDASYNRLTNVNTLTTLPHLSWVYLHLNLLDLSPGSAATNVIQGLLGRSVYVWFLPQNQPPSISVPSNWIIPENVASSLWLSVSDDETPQQQLVLTAHSSNSALISDANTIICFSNAFWQWNLNLVPTLNQTGTTTITLTATDDAGLSSTTSFPVTVLMPLAFEAQAINYSNSVWSTFGTTPWFAQTNVSHDGQASAQSGSPEAWLGTTVTGPGVLTFWWKSSGTNKYWTGGYFTATCTSSGLSGDSWIAEGTDWRRETMSLPSGSWVLRWQGSGSSVPGDVSATWLDEVSFVPGPTVSWVEVPQASSFPPGYFWLDLHGEIGANYDLEVSSDLRNWSTLSRLNFYNFEYGFNDWNSTAAARFYRLHKVMPVWLEIVGGASGGQCQLMLHGQPATSCQILVTTNLLTWSTLATVTNTLGSVSWTDVLPINSAQRFYRAVQSSQ